MNKFKNQKSILVETLEKKIDTTIRIKALSSQRLTFKQVLMCVVQIYIVIHSTLS